MVLLMLGVYAAASAATRSSTGVWRLCCWWRRVSLLSMLPEGRLVTFGGSFVLDDFARFLKILALIGSAVAILMSFDYFSRREGAAVRICRADAAVDARHDDDDLGDDLIALYLGLELMSLALYVVAAINRDNAALDRGRPEIFRPRRAVLGHAALRRLADLWLHRHGLVRRHRRRRRSTGGIGLIFGLVFLFAGLLLQGLGGAVPHVDAGRLRGRADAGHGVLRRRAEGRRRWRMFVRVDDRWRFPASSSQWQQIVVFVAIASMVLGAFAAIGQRNIKRLMAYSSIGHMGFALVGLAAGTAAGRAGRHHLYRDLSRHDARHLRLHPVDAARRRAWSRTSTISPACRAPIR